MTASHETVYVDAGHKCKPDGAGKDGELRRCTTCGKWWRMAPGFTYRWESVKPWHFRENTTIREHERRMHVLVPGRPQEDDR